jgi:hypothetical protein
MRSKVLILVLSVVLCLVAAKFDHKKLHFKHMNKKWPEHNDANL